MRHSKYSWWTSVIVTTSIQFCYSFHGIAIAVCEIVIAASNTVTKKFDVETVKYLFGFLSFNHCFYCIGLS